MELESSDGNWTVGIEEIGFGCAFGGVSVIKNELYSECVSAVKIKTVLLKSNIFFPIFIRHWRRAPSLHVYGVVKPLLNKGFKLPVGCFERPFFFSVEPPFGGRSLHKRVDIAHPHQVPDAL